MTEIIRTLNDEALNKIAKVIANGGVIAFPTETVYALAADATNVEAVERIYQLKNRDRDKPLSILVGDVSHAKKIVEFDQKAHQLALKFFPGSLTLVLNSRNDSNLASNINKINDSIGVRMPSNHVALEILRAVNMPLIGTSANISAQKDAISGDEVLKFFDNKIDILVDQDVPITGIPSTIVDLSGAQLKILRMGGITKKDIEAALNLELE